jgi:hypothetical protein
MSTGSDCEDYLEALFANGAPRTDLSMGACKVDERHGDEQSRMHSGPSLPGDRVLSGALPGQNRPQPAQRPTTAGRDHSGSRKAIRNENLSFSEQLEWFQEDDTDNKHTHHIERFMKISIFFWIASALIFCDVLHRYSLFYDYHKEDFLHKATVCCVTLWLANLKRLGWNGRTTQRDLSRVFMAMTIRCFISLTFAHEEQLRSGGQGVSCFICAVLVKYRPEYLVTWALFDRTRKALFDQECLDDVKTLFDQDFFWWDSYTRVFGSFGFAGLVYFWHFQSYVHRLLSWKLIQTEQNKFQDAWKREQRKCGDDLLKQLSAQLTFILAELRQQRKTALRSIAWHRRLLAHLEERVGRWSLHDDASARQNISNPDQLMQDALTCSKAFNNLISEIVVCVNSSTKHTKDNTSEGIDTIHNDSNKAMRRSNCELSTIRSDSEPLIADGLQFIEGPMKRPMRVLQKVVIPSYV